MLKGIIIEAIIPAGNISGNHEDGKPYSVIELHNLARIIDGQDRTVAFRFKNKDTGEVLSNWIIKGFLYTTKTDEGCVIPPYDDFPPKMAIDLDSELLPFKEIEDPNKSGYSIKNVYRTYAAPAYLYVMTNKNPILVDLEYSGLDECEKKANELLDRVFNPSGPIFNPSGPKR